MLSRRTILATAGLGVLALASGRGQAGQPRALAYWVRRDGSPIGEHVITFRPSAGGGQEVAFATDIAVKIAFITAFRFTHEATEVWAPDGHLASLVSKTDDDGTAHEVSATAGPQGLVVTADGARSTLPAGTLVHDHWNPANVARSHLLSIYDGTMLDIAFRDVGTQPTEINGAAHPARRFDATGDLTRSFWFDSDDRLVKVAFTSRGSAITYELRT